MFERDEKGQVSLRPLEYLVQLLIVVLLSLPVYSIANSPEKFEFDKPFLLKTTDGQSHYVKSVEFDEFVDGRTILMFTTPDGKEFFKEPHQIANFRELVIIGDPNLDESLLELDTEPDKPLNCCSY